MTEEIDNVDGNGNGKGLFGHGGIGNLFGKFFGGFEISGLWETFAGLQEGTDIDLSGSSAEFEVNWDDTVVTEAHGAMASARSAVKTSGNAKGKFSIGGKLKRLFAPVKEDSSG